jgi:hypothetical protein
MRDVSVTRAAHVRERSSDMNERPAQALARTRTQSAGEDGGLARGRARGETCLRTGSLDARDVAQILHAIASYHRYWHSGCYGDRLVPLLQKLAGVCTALVAQFCAQDLSQVVFACTVLKWDADSGRNARVKERLLSGLVRRALELVPSLDGLCIEQIIGSIARTRDEGCDIGADLLAQSAEDLCARVVELLEAAQARGAGRAGEAAPNLTANTVASLMWGLAKCQVPQKSPFDGKKALRMRVLTCGRWRPARFARRLRCAGVWLASSRPTSRASRHASCRQSCGRPPPRRRAPRPGRRLWRLRCLCVQARARERGGGGREGGREGGRDRQAGGLGTRQYLLICAGLSIASRATADKRALYNP